MIIVDLSQILLSTMMAHLGNHKNTRIEMDIFRHFALNTIRSIRMKFGEQYGEMVIACDSTNYWRRQLFPFYKANRKKDRDASELDWPQIFECLKTIKMELNEFFPYRVIEVETAEADDIIATLVVRYGIERYSVLHERFTGMKTEPILIVSGDKDFRQLHRFGNVAQYDPLQKKMLKCDDPVAFLAEHIVVGDRGDGVPNMLSPDDTFVTGARQKRISPARLEELIRLSPNNLGSEELTRNWHRNSSLIDLTKIPSHISEAIWSKYQDQSGKDRKKLFRYFIDHNLKNLMKEISHF